MMNLLKLPVAGKETHIKGPHALRTKQNRSMKKYPQFEGNLALADESKDLREEPRAKPRASTLRLVQGEEEELSELPLVKEVVVGIGLCLGWFLFVLALYRIARILNMQDY